MTFARFAAIALAVAVVPSAAAQTFQGLDFTAPKKKAKKTTLVVKLGTEVKGAKLLVDGKPLGELPREEQVLTAGEHTVRVERLGFKTWEQKVVVAKGPNEVTVVLEPEGGVFTIDASEAGATCSIDGAAEEPLPLTRVLPPGRHSLRIAKAGFSPETINVDAQAGVDQLVNAELRAVADRPARASLEPQERDADLDAERGGAATQVSKADEPVYTKWYLWVGVGAAVLGAAVAVAVSQQPPAPIEPSTVCHGPCDVTIGRPTGALPLRR